ncbi:hypothetical protein PILCRDRAFT_818149 [Piloderma croceum F 1598]|uniref:Uncharacterized protein n=1 Tax=Piloderma croceum (strain F 1598) TaxID=765440 RepID=A0A0C3FJE3_PILCF|nr:hypothetical protein PILCRDRAFT_818149 [Piloderma croceum F 1598]
MLKRQRQSSPLPSSHVPFVASDSIDEKHEAKRRRIMAPVLDGEKRGWGVPVPDVYEDEYDEEEEEIQEELEQSGFGGGLAVEEQWRDSGMYKSTNSFLHDLHALHQHRLIASSSSTPSSPNPLSQQQRQSSSSSSFRPSSKRLRMPSFDHDLTAQRGLDGHAVEDLIPLGEERMVKERYEDTNRLLGSLVLSRRRELQGSSGGI